MSNFENNDFDAFINLDNDYTPVSASPATNQIPSSSNTLASSQPAFSGPSRQYDSHRQQTGLPVGALANTFAVNQANGLQYRQGNMGFVMPNETLNIPLSTLDDFDFGKSQYLDMNDMDFDADDSPSDMNNMFYSPGGSQIKSEPSQPAPIQRIYPGMHSQQAAQAKAAQAQRQQEMLRQQQPKQIPGQLPLPTQAPKAAKDPHVEESISRLLNRMRHSSTSSVDENATPAPGNGMSNVSRSKKDEEDMDEDERLLASEEGKKLSSKERRQLRNKVSARAFRSRRKEYIGQLEGEVAAKVQEANDLRVQNRQLMEENTRLTDLTRMLLSSQAFSGFLQELSNSGMPVPAGLNNQQIQSQSQPQPQPQPQRKDVPAHEAARQLQRQNQQHVGMTMIPETQLDTSDFSSNWNMPLPSNDFQVFSLTSMPEPPTLDLDALTEKKSESSVRSSTPKSDFPELPSLPQAVEVTPGANTRSITKIGGSDDCVTDLYADEPAVTVVPSSTVASLIESLKKPDPSVHDTVSAEVEDEQSSSSRLEEMCSTIEASCTRLDSWLP